MIVDGFQDYHEKMAAQFWNYIQNCTELMESDASFAFIENCTLNSTTFFTTPKSEPFLYDVPTEIVILLSFFYGSISMMAVVGNMLVIWVISTSRRMQNVTNCFIANLALADIMIGLFAIPFQFQAALLQRWNLPQFMCPFCPFVQVLSVSVSIFTLTAIALDRHRAILNPLRVYPSRFRAKVCITCIWIIGVLIALPMALALRVEFIQHTDSAGNVATKPFCYNTQFPEQVMLCYRLLILFVQYVVPLCIISCVYVRIALRLWGSHAPGNAQYIRDATLMKNKMKVIKMLVIVVVMFAFCWLPLQTYMVLQDIFPEINKYHYINIVFFCCDWLAMSNSCCNPFIYGIYNEKFKREFQQRFPFRSRTWRSPTAESLDTDKTVIASRPSVRSNNATPNSHLNDSYHRRCSFSRNSNGLYYFTAYRSQKKNNCPKDKNMYVLQVGRGGTIVECSSESEFDELCL